MAEYKLHNGKRRRMSPDEEMNFVQQRAVIQQESAQRDAVRISRQNSLASNRKKLERRLGVTIEELRDLILGVEDE